jgi:hypothetical protein
MCVFDLGLDDIRQISRAFQKVWANLDSLR